MIKEEKSQNKEKMKICDRLRLLTFLLFRFKFGLFGTIEGKNTIIRFSKQL